MSRWKQIVTWLSMVGGEFPKIDIKRRIRRGFTDRIGSLTDDEPVGAGATLETNVEPDGDEVIVYATVDGATGEVARWQDPE